MMLVQRSILCRMHQPTGAPTRDASNIKASPQNQLNVGSYTITVGTSAGPRLGAAAAAPK